MEDITRNLLERQMAYLAVELVRTAWENRDVELYHTEVEPDRTKELPADYGLLDLRVAEGTPSGVLIPSLVEALYKEHLMRAPGQGGPATFCQQILPDLIKEFFPDLMTKPPAISHLQRICDELHLEFTHFDQAPGVLNSRGVRSSTLDREPAGQSQAWRELLKEAARAAWSQAPILLTGESGTGKEVVARFIHDHSPRAQGPFVPLNCGAFPDDLLESELFGYRKGAFTEAKQDKPGLVETANRGTLFLDEISELSGKLQVKLLRFTQEHTIIPLGSVKSVAVNTRIVAASNRDLALEMEKKAFRTDLYYRLNVFRFTIPPLRRRTEDISILARHFIRVYNKDNAAKVTGISPEVMEVFDKYSWPGNVRELENVIHRAVVLARTGKIGLEHLPEELSAPSGGESILASSRLDQSALVRGIEEALSLPERADGKSRRLGSSLSVQYLAGYFNLVGENYFRTGDFAGYLSRSEPLRRRDKLASQIIGAWFKFGILEHNHGKAQASRYKLSNRYFRDVAAEEDE